jgi:hypothetical protein
MAPPSPDQKHRPISPQNAGSGAVLSQSTPASNMYLDPSLRLPIPQTQAQPPTSTQQNIAPHPHNQQAMGARQSTDGLGLLIEAFDTSQQGNMAPSGPGSAGQQYNPHAGPPPQEYYPQAPLAINDGYENELRYYMADDMPTIQTWAGNTNIGGGIYGGY